MRFINIYAKFAQVLVAQMANHIVLDKYWLESVESKNPRLYTGMKALQKVMEFCRDISLYETVQYDCSQKCSKLPILRIDLTSMIYLNPITLSIVLVLHSHVIFVYKSVDKLSPSCLHDYIKLTSSVHRTGTHQATRGNFFKSTKNTTLYGLQTIHLLGAKLWNTIPLFIHFVSSILDFPSKLKSYFLNSYSWS